MSSDPVVWAIVPAAGSGKRMGCDRPKQYLTLHNRPIILHTLDRLCRFTPIKQVLVGLTADDPHWAAIKSEIDQPPGVLETYTGGEERAHTVLNGLENLADRAAGDDWVLVHDAARPCVRLGDMQTLIDRVADHPVGGLLGLPVSDTVKRADANGSVLETVDRSGLWRALTPQVFRYSFLKEALIMAIERGEIVTDESAAIEAKGLRPLIVSGHADNIKITHPGDLALAELFMRQQAEE